MTSLILSAASRYLLPLLILFSWFLLFRGHNHPGGGFVGGLVASAAFALYMIAYGVEQTRFVLRFDPRNLFGMGLLVAMCSVCFPLLLGEPIMTGIWADVELPIIGKPGTPLFFDVGVYLVVMGVILTIIFPLAEE